MWGTPIGAAAASGDGSRTRMEKFLSENSSEYNGQRCHSNREQTEFTSEEEDDVKTGRFLYPVLDLHKSGQTPQNDSSKLWSAAPSSRITPPLAHSHAASGGGGLVGPPLGGFADHRGGGGGGRHHLELLQHHDRGMADRDGGVGVHNMMIDSLGGGPGEPSSTAKGGGGGGNAQHQTLKMSRTIKSYHCRMCEQEFENKSDMQRHAKEAHRMEEKGHKCSKCFKSFPSSQQLAQHSLVHTNVRKYPCRFCEKAFKQLSHVQQHQRIHTGERPYQCTVEGCSKAFRQLSSLQQHIKGHNIPLPKSYPIKHGLSALADMTGGGGGGGGGFGHNDKINSSLARPHDLTCQVCEKHCVDEVRFFRHIHKYHPDYWRVFSGGRPLNDFIEMRDVKERDKVYTCDICHKNFSNETGYWKHMATHPGIDTDQQVQLFKCLVCKKLFTKEGYLLRHMEMKLDDQHCKALVELKKNSAIFRVTQAETYLLPPMMGQVDNDPMSPDEVDAKPRLSSADIGSGGGTQAGGGGGGGGGSAFETQDKAASQKLMPPRAHQSSSGYPSSIPLNRSLSLDHQVVPYGRSIHSPDMFDERANHRLERSESSAAAAAVRSKSPPPGLSRLVVCDPRDPADGAAMSPKASLSGSSSPCSPMSVQSFSYHGDNQQQQQQSGRPGTSDGRNCPTSHRALYSPGVHVAPSYYPKSTGGAQEMLHQSRGGAYHGSAHPFPHSPASSCLPRSSPEEHQQRSPEDHKPSFSAHDYLDPASPYVQRFHHALPAPALAPPSMQNGGSGGGRATSSPHIMIPPGPFVYPSVMSPSYGGGAGPVRQLQQDSLLRRGGGGEMPSSSDVVGMDVFQRHGGGGGGGGGGGEIADRGIGATDIYMRRSDPSGGGGGGGGGDHHHGADVYGLRSTDTADNYLHRSDMLERDLNAYLRRNDISESEVDAFLRRNDISECYIASALSQLARSIPGFR